MRNRKRIWPGQTAHKRATYEGPLPLAIIGMLELTPRPGQANADRENYDFSLDTPSSPVFQGLLAIVPESTICEQHPLDARDRMADRCSLFRVGRQIRGPPAAGLGRYDRTDGSRDQCPPEPVEQSLL